MWIYVTLIIAVICRRVTIHLETLVRVSVSSITTSKLIIVALICVKLNLIAVQFKLRQLIMGSQYFFNTCPYSFVHCLFTLN
jgi:hypothetical protein